jgi:hypothetical protein
MAPRQSDYRRRAIALATSLLLISMACALLQTPTPIDWTSPTATQEAQPSPSPTSAPIARVTSTPTGAPKATDSPTPDPTSTPAASPTAVASTHRLQFAAGATQATVEGQLPATGRQRFVLHIEGGQLVEISATPASLGQELRLSLAAAEGATVRPLGDPFIRTTVPTTQDYTIDLVSDAGAITYTLSVLVPVRIRFAPGATTAQVTGSLDAGQSRHYVLRALGGQTMTLNTASTRGEVRLVVYGADGTVLQSGMGELTDFEGVLPSTQDYLIAVQAGPDSPAAYTLFITIPPPDP